MLRGPVIHAVTFVSSYWLFAAGITAVQARTDHVMLPAASQSAASDPFENAALVIAVQIASRCELAPDREGPLALENESNTRFVVGARELVRVKEGFKGNWQDSNLTIVQSASRPLIDLVPG